MKKYVLCGSICVLVCLSACQPAPPAEETMQTTQGTAEHVKDTEKADTLQMQTFAECRKEAETLLEDVATAYDNLHFKPFKIIVTDKDEVYPLHMYYLDTYMPIPKRKEITKEIRQQYERLKTIFPDVKKDEVEILLTKEDGDWEYLPCTDENLKAIEVGEYDDYEYARMRYRVLEQDERGFPKKLKEITTDQKIYDEAYQMRGITFLDGHFNRINTEDCQEAYKTLNQYEANATDGSLEDAWDLNGTEVKVKDAIQYVEQYLEESPFHQEGVTKKKVARVKVFPLPNGKYGYYFMLRRSYDGVVFEALRDLNEGRQDGYGQDIGYCSMDEEGKIAQLDSNMQDGHFEYAGESLKMVCSIRSALNNISNEIGAESSYTVVAIEFIYRQKEAENQEYNQDITPFWSVTAYNEKDDKETIFYVNPTTGEVTYRITGYHMVENDTGEK